MFVVAVPAIVFSGMFAILVGYTLPDTVRAVWISPVPGAVMYS